MNLEAFLHDLQFDTHKSTNVDWEVDWADAPLKYKLYRNLPIIPLSPEVPLTLEERESPAKPDLTGIGHFLWYVFGLSQLSHSYHAPVSIDQSPGPMQMFRRFVPSGGGLYPNECYVYLKTKDAPAGVYHYDAAHHRLVMLREGNFDSYLNKALGNRCEMSACFGAVFVSTMFWKNFYKYYNFAYRLQGLDAGVLIGQLLEVAKRFGFTTGVYFQFLDQAVNHLIGLSEQEEAVYAVIPLSAERDIALLADSKEHFSASELCRELPAIRHEHYERSRNIKEYPMLIQMNEASSMETSDSFRQIGAARSGDTRDSGIRAIYLPSIGRPSYDLASTCRSRYSPETEFILDKVTERQLAVLFEEAAASFPYRNDLDGAYNKPNSRISLFACLYQVEGVPDGAYRYDIATHSLRSVLPGDHRLRLQEGMSLHNINLFQVPLCLHVAGDNDYLKSELGYRGYRILQMEAGMLVHRLLLAASVIGMGGRPLLGFNTSICDDLYKLANRGLTSLIQLPIGPHQQRPRLEGTLHG